MVRTLEINMDEPLTKFKENCIDSRPVSSEKIYIGFGNLPNQLHKKITEKGVQFNILLIGESGTGSTTFINALFNAKIMQKQTYCDLPNSKKITIEVTEVVLIEKGMNLHLRVFRVRDYGDLIDNSYCWSTIEKCITERFEAYFVAESSLDRPRDLDDCRIHCCLYLIRSKLRQIDLLTLRAIVGHVAVIPVITKADCFTTEEIRCLKSSLMEQFLREEIQIFDFSAVDMHATEKASLTTAEMAARVPFAVVASEDICSMGDRSVRGRRYDWGTVEVDNLRHSDLAALRYLLLCVGLPELIRYTDSVTYKKYRNSRMNFKRDLEPPKEAMGNPISHLKNERISMEEMIQDAEKKMDELFRSKISQKTAMLEETQNAYELKIRVYQQENAVRREKLEILRNSFEKEQADMLKEYPSFSTFKLKKEKDRKKFQSTSTLKLFIHQ